MAWLPVWSHKYVKEFSFSVTYNRRSSEIQGTALGKSLRAWTCIYRSMPAGVASQVVYFRNPVGVHERTSMKEHLVWHGSKHKIQVYTTKRNKWQQKRKQNRTHFQNKKQSWHAFVGGTVSTWGRWRIPVNKRQKRHQKCRSNIHCSKGTCRSDSRFPQLVV